MKKIDIKGDIISNDYAWIYDWMEWDYTSPRQIENALKEANGDEVVFLINSGGGSVFDGYEIFNIIKDYSGKTTAKIIGIAASAASFIAMAADKVQASALSQIMIHRASNGNQGNSPSHYHNAEFLQQVDNTIVKAYTMRNGKTSEEMIELMDKTTWFTAEEALENGIVDEIVNDKCKKPKAYNSLDNKQELIDKLLELGNVENVKQALLNKQISLGQGVVNVSIDNTKKEEEEHMTLDQFKSEQPDLYNQIVKDASEEAVKNERERIQSINKLARQGVEDQIKEGIENGLTAGEVAINILNAQSAINAQQEAAIKNDAEESGVNNVSSTPTPQNNDDQEKQSALTNMAAFMNGGRK